MNQIFEQLENEISNNIVYYATEFSLKRKTNVLVTPFIRNLEYVAEHNYPNIPKSVIRSAIESIIIDIILQRFLENNQ